MAAQDDLENQILADGPSAGTAYLILSAWKEDGHFKRVIQEGIKALKVFPSDLRIRKLLGEAYLEAGLITQAEAEMEKVAELTGELITAYRHLADIYSRQGREGEALKALKIYLSHRPDDDRAADLLARLEIPAEPHGGAPPEGQREIHEIARETVEEDAKTAEEPLPAPEPAGKLPEIATPTLAEVYFGQGQVERAVAIYEKVIRHNPEDEKSRRRLSELMSSPGMERAAGGEEKKSFDRGKEKKKRMISVLETWRDNIREASKKPTPA